MSKLFILDVNSRMVLAVGFCLFSLLVVGAGKISGNLQDRIVQRRVERTEWSTVAVKMFSHMSGEKQTVWNSIAIENPQLLLKANTIEFRNASAPAM